MSCSMLKAKSTSELIRLKTNAISRTARNWVTARLMARAKATTYVLCLVSHSPCHKHLPVLSLQWNMLNIAMALPIPIKHNKHTTQKNALPVWDDSVYWNLVCEDGPVVGHGQ